LRYSECMGTNNAANHGAGVDDLLNAAVELRSVLLPAYEARSGDATAVCRSRGQCAVTALIVKAEFGGVLVSTVVNGESHWFNRVTLRSGTYDLDLTGDQFGLPAVQCATAGSLYASARERSPSEVFAETFLRACQLALRAGMPDALAALRKDRPLAA
jgi:hypothetical protein